jgi:hypothetical protein
VQRARESTPTRTVARLTGVHRERIRGVFGINLDPVPAPMCQDWVLVLGGVPWLLRVPKWTLCRVSDTARGYPRRCGKFGQIIATNDDLQREPPSSVGDSRRATDRRSDAGAVASPLLGTRLLALKERGAGAWGSTITNHRPSSNSVRLRDARREL